MRVSAIVLAVAAAASAVAATNIFYGSRATKPENYGNCTHAAANMATIISIETTAVDFQCWEGGVADVDCYGIASRDKACPALATRCRSYGGKWTAGSCRKI